jgi:hypothetical protein
LLIFSNEKYVAVSLHLWDVSRQVFFRYWWIWLHIFLPLLTNCIFIGYSTELAWSLAWQCDGKCSRIGHMLSSEWCCSRLWAFKEWW